MSPVAREHSFDELTRGMACGSISRGKALKLMGAALVGGTLASLGIGEAGADPPGCKRNGKNCTKDKVCCSGHCESGTCADAPPTCGSIGATCTGNTDCCSGRCASGMCAEPCPSGKVLLSNGTCATACSTDISVCSACADASCAPEISGVGAFCFERRSNSGLCATTSDCPSGRFCFGGTCVVACG